MHSLTHFLNFVKEINTSNSRLHKQSVLQKYATDTVIWRYLQIAFNPFEVYGISSKKLHKQVHTPSGYVFGGVLELFDYLAECNTGTDQDIAACQEVLDGVSAWSSEAAELLEQLICKDLSIGVDAKTINKEIPGLIPTFNVQLANKYFDKPTVVTGKKFCLTTKIDGGRIIALKENGQVSFYTRAGQLYEGLVDLEEEMARLMPDNTCLDGEITLLSNPKALTSKEQYKETMKIVRTKDKAKHGIKMLVFDWMPADDFKRQQCDFPYKVRRNELERLFNEIDFRYFELLPKLYVGDDPSKIKEILEDAIADGEEGIMINIWDALYEFKRTNNLLKCKVFNSADLRVVGLEQGTGKYTGMLGAFICEYKGGHVRVGSGLTDAQRAEVFKEPLKYIDTIIEISYFEETKDATGKPSLRFPTFKDFRPDKTEPNY
jgi:DNA ligase-1